MSKVATPPATVDYGLWPDGDPRLTREYFVAHPEDFVDQCLKIRTKDSTIAPFRDNFSQRKFQAIVDEERAAGRRPQIITLKSRQIGLSTKVQAIAFKDTFLNEHREAFIITDKTEHSKLMIQIQRRLLRNLPPGVRPHSKDMKLENVHGIQFPWDSRIQVETEGDAHSMTANILHLSEFAYYKKPADTLKEAMPAVPMDPSSLIVIESTANGQGNEFYDLWCQAMEDEMKGVHHSERGWRPFFVPWWQHEEYTYAQPWFVPQDTNRRERELARRFKLNMRQLAWRRWCISKIFKGDEDEFETRYPTTWQEAFKRSGRPVFEPEQMDRLLDEAPPRKNEGSIWIQSAPCEIEWSVEQKKPILVPSSTGRLRLFRDFDPRRTYRLGADPSEGDRKSDPSPLELIDFTGDWTEGKKGSIDQIGEWHGRAAPDVLATYAAWLGQLYGFCQIVPEANGVGLAFCETLVRLNYPNIYMRQTHEEDVSGEITMKPGIVSTNKAKHAAAVVFRAWLREEKGVISSPQLLNEMGTTVYFRREQTTLGQAALQTQITKPSNKTIDCVWAFAWPLLVHKGDEANPLLPMEPKVILSAQAQVLLAMERNPRAEVESLSLTLTGMTADELMSVADARARRHGKIRKGMPPWLATR